MNDVSLDATSSTKTVAEDSDNDEEMRAAIAASLKEY